MKVLKMTVALLAMMLMAFGAHAQTPQEAADAYTAAGEKITARDYVGAIEKLEEAISIGELAGDGAAELVGEAKKMLPAVYYRAGGTMAQKGELEEGVKYLEKAVELAQEQEDVRTLGGARNMVAQVYVKMGADAFNADDFATAAEIFQKGYVVSPDNPQLALYLAQSYGGLKDYDRALDVLRKVLEFERLGEKYEKEVGQAKEYIVRYMMLKANDIASSQPAEAIELLAESTGITPDPQAYVLLLQTANNSKNFDKVIEFGEKAAEAQTDSTLKGTAYFFLGSAYDNKGDQAKALDNYRKVTAGPYAAQAKTQIAAIEAAQA